MYDVKPLRTHSACRVGLPSLGMIGRLILALAAIIAVSILTLPSMAKAAGAMRLRGDVTAKGDVITLGDLVENAPAGYAGRALFRAPALGATGTIQVRRVIDAALALNLDGIETGGRLQISVQRAARRVGPAEIETVLKQALQTSFGLDGKALSLRLDGESPVLLASADLTGAPTALDVTYDPRSRRVTGLIVLGDRQASLRVAGQTLEMREIAVLTRSLNRGESLGAADLVAERRPREAVPADAQASVAAVVGQVAQRGLNAGSVLRSGDVAPPDLVQRGDAVTIVFETTGVSLSLRGIANESGRIGASVSVTNAASKKVLQAIVTGPGRVSVSPVRPPQPLAALETKPRLN